MHDSVPLVELAGASLVHGASARAEVINLADFRRRRGTVTVLNAPHLSVRSAPTQSWKSEPPPTLFDQFGAALIVLSVAVGPALTWLLVG